jgi:peptidoglycan/LPS O-acetylase OafA/YrhL
VPSTPQPADPAAKRSGYVPALDGLRAFAVVLVILLHISYGYFYGGRIGVDVFFVLSGYLITGLLAVEFSASGTIRFDLFYARRFYRLLPPIVLTLLLAFLLRPCGPWPLSSTWAVLFSYANFLPKDRLGMLSPTWSLSVEEQFYLLWPMFLLFLLKRKKGVFFRLVLPAMLAASSVALMVVLSARGVDREFLYTFTPTHMDGLFVGAVVALLGRGPRVQQVAHTCSRFWLPEVVLAIILLHGLHILPYGDLLLPFLKSPLFGLLILCIVYEKREVFYIRLLRLPWAVWLGKRSYGLYLYHLPISYGLEVFRVKGSVVNLLVISVLRVVVPIIIADLSYRYIEMPFLRKKNTLKWNLPKSPAAPAQAGS